MRKSERVCVSQCELTERAFDFFIKTVQGKVGISRAQVDSKGLLLSDDLPRDPMSLGSEAKVKSPATIKAKACLSPSLDF